MQIPINKGGEQTRFKVGLPDGSALMVSLLQCFIFALLMMSYG
jgi:hypothetical protein